MRRMVSFFAVLLMTAMLCGCTPIHSPFVGTWQCEVSQENYPEQFTLGLDEIGTVDGNACEWAVSKEKSELTLLIDGVGEMRYKYSFLGHGTLYLNDSVYHLQE